MLYIFHVDTGTMMTFDINLALENVMYLKTMIEKVCKIPANKQVLLVSGGEVLRPDTRVCSYSAGTDTNPIYMFSKSIIESSDPPKSYCEYGSDDDLEEQVDKCIAMAPSCATVNNYAQLAHKFWEAALEHKRLCEKLVHDQHLQQQGWAAVVANMEDVTADFHERAADFEEKFKEQLSKKKEYDGFLSRFNEDLEILSSIPILPALRLNAASNPFTAFDELHGDSESYDDENQSIKEEDEDIRSCDDSLPNSSDTQKVSNEGSSSSKGAGGSTTSEGDEGVELSKDGQKSKKGLIRTKSRQITKEALTLLHWITVKENQESLKHIAEYCQNAMDLFDSNVMTSLHSEIAKTLVDAKRENMKKINGLEERLSDLEQLMCETRRLEQEQHDLAFAFQNKHSANSLTDLETLKLLCESHMKQLQNMLKNHIRMCDMRRRCAKAKEELAKNLYHRLQWIVFIENSMFEIDSKLMFYHRSLSRLKRHLAVVSQLHRAPRLFCTAVHEIVRRRKFSQAFLSWASDLAYHILSFHNEEVTRRKKFDSIFSGHFLGGLFPGTEDMPPPFATQAPRVFDGDLPKLTQIDIDTLTSRLPHLTPEIAPCDMTPVIEFFHTRSEHLNKQKVDQDTKNVQSSKEGVDRGFESETDTEEFEKVGQSPIDRGGGVAQLPVAPTRTDATTLTEVRSHTRQPPIKPPRARPPTPLPLAPIPEAASPHPECGCLLSPSLSSPTAMSPRPPSPSSPTAAPGHRADFEPAEFYIEESPPVSLEWGCSASPLDSQTLVSLLQENIGSKRSESETLKELISSITNKYTEVVNNIKSDMQVIKSDVICNTAALTDNCSEIISTWEKCVADNALREREAFQRLTVDHELEMNDIKQVIKKKDDEISNMKIEILAIKNEYSQLIQEKNEEISNLLAQIQSIEDLKLEHKKAIEEMELAKQKAIKETEEKMAQDYKGEIESLRSRFRLVALTSVDRSPSESSLEKIERTDMIEISTHKAILLQTKADLETEKEEAVKEAVDKLEEELKTKHAAELEAFKSKVESEKQVNVKNAIKRIMDEKDRQLESHRDRESRLLKECLKYKETISQMTDPETIDTSTGRLQLDASTSTDFKTCKKMPKSHTPLGIVPQTLKLSSCEKGDIVFVLWDGAHCNYTVLQESSTLYLLNPDCLSALDLKLNVKDESERRLYTVGRVEIKEYCHAVRSGNKYQVAVGQRFYRVKVEPLKSNETITKDSHYCCDNLSSTSKDLESSQSKSVIRMTMSEATCSYESSSKHGSKESPMTKSVYYPNALCASVRELTDVLEEKSNEVAIPENSEISKKSSKKETECLESDAKSKKRSNSTTEEKNKTKIDVETKTTLVDLNIQTAASVPYESSNDVCLSDTLSNELFSEIAEEAAP